MQTAQENSNATRGALKNSRMAANKGDRAQNDPPLPARVFQELKK